MALVKNADVAESPNGAITQFTIPEAYSTSGIFLYIVNGITYHDAVFTTPASGVFTMSFAPHTGDVIEVIYTADTNLVAPEPVIVELCTP